jgi:hypothetical protein
MDKKTIGDWIMYHEVQRLIREGLSFTAIGKALVMDRRTVKRYSRMSEADYASFLVSKEIRDKMLTPYESFVHDKLMAHPAVSAAQMHDWLKEHHPGFVDTAPKTVYNLSWHCGGSIIFPWKKQAGSILLLQNFHMDSRPRQILAVIFFGVQKTAASVFTFL